ncbi:MAG: serine/threonine dehydratase [Anaerolineaceae bacterium]|nr:serine/threonine dehydratase [Anaerolineaceae bacterium]
MIAQKSILEAVKRLEGKINKTPITFDPKLNVYLKWENKQKTGAFKVRGALNKILGLEPWEQERGLVAASAGNHGLGVAYAAKLVGAKATVFIPENSVINKEQAIRDYEASVVKVKGGYSAAEKEAQSFAIKKGATWVSPYNDPFVIAGHATIGYEIINQIQNFDATSCLVPVSGGGLISGIGSAFEHLKKNIKLIGVQAENSPYFHSLYHYGHYNSVLEEASIADGLTGAVERSSITIPLVRTMLDDFILVNENEIEQAVAYAWYHYHEVLEGSAAVPLAAILSKKINVEKTILVISGGNIQQEFHQSICSKWEGVWQAT